MMSCTQEISGYSDVEQKVPVDEETIFQVASLTKNMVAALVGMLVNEDKLRWDQPIHEILPDWNVQDSTVRNQTTILDCLAHRTGLQMNNYWLASNNNIIIPPGKSMNLINGLKAVKPFRGQFQYNNLSYEIASHVIKELTGSPWNELLQSRILDPLQMKRTGTHQNFAGPHNVSKAYGTLSNRSPVRIGDPQIGDNTVAGPGGGARSTLNDMLKLAKAWLVTAYHQFSHHATSTPDLPLKQNVSSIMSSQIPLAAPSYHETSYAMGFARTQLPGPMGAIGLNGAWLKDAPGRPGAFPLVGKEVPPQLVVYHQGSNPGVLTAFNLLPETQSAIVALSNTLALVDTADWVGQMLLEAVLDVPEQSKNKYVKITEDTVNNALAWFEPLYKTLREGRTSEAPRSLEEYTGSYWNNPINTVHIDVMMVEGRLNIVF